MMKISLNRKERTRSTFLRNSNQRINPTTSRVKLLQSRKHQIEGIHPQTNCTISLTPDRTRRTQEENLPRRKPLNQVRKRPQTNRRPYAGKKSSQKLKRQPLLRSSTVNRQNSSYGVGQTPLVGRPEVHPDKPECRKLRSGKERADAEIRKRDQQDWVWVKKTKGNKRYQEQRNIGNSVKVSENLPPTGRLNCQTRTLPNPPEQPEGVRTKVQHILPLNLKT